jgi:hypothetical protein
VLVRDVLEENERAVGLPGRVVDERDGSAPPPQQAVLPPEAPLESKAVAMAARELPGDLADPRVVVGVGENERVEREELFLAVPDDRAEGEVRAHDAAAEVGHRHPDASLVEDLP